MAEQLVLLVLLSITFQSISTLEIVPSGKLPLPLGFGASIYDGEDSIFIFGGKSRFGVMNEVLRYNINTETVTTAGRLFAGLHSAATGTDGNGTFYHFGGHNGLSGVGTVYTVTANEPEPILLPNDLPRWLWSHTAASDLQGTVYLTGGIEPLGPQIFQYNTNSGEMIYAGRLPDDIYTVTMTWVGDACYGFSEISADARIQTMVFKFSPDSGLTSTILPKYLGRTQHSSVVTVGTDIYIVGGHAYGDKFQLLKFDTLEEKMESIEITNFSQELLMPHSVYVPKLNRIYSFGGAAEDGIYFEDIFYIQL